MSVRLADCLDVVSPVCLGRSRLIRPPDPAIRSTTVAYGRYNSAEACRRLVHLAFRDAHSALDLTFAAGRFWRDPLPPGLLITSNNLDARAATDLHVDFRATGLADGAYDLVVYDPPHVADGGANGIMARRYGSIRTTASLRELIVDGAQEAWRIARVGIVVKVTDHHHGGAFIDETDWIRRAIPAHPYTRLSTVRARGLASARQWHAERVPRSNGAVYLVYRRDDHHHVDFDALYRRQALQLAARFGAPAGCHTCNAPLPIGRSDRTTCSSACRQRAYRERMRHSAAMGTLEAWYEYLEVGELLDEVARITRSGNLSRKEGRPIAWDPATAECGCCTA